jgi:molecular chaperone GrpE
MSLESDPAADEESSQVEKRSVTDENNDTGSNENDEGSDEDTSPSTEGGSEEETILRPGTASGAIPQDVEAGNQLFYGYDVTDPEEIANALSDVEPKAAMAIGEVLRENQRLRKEVGAQKERTEQIENEFQGYKARKEEQTETLKDTATKSFIKDAVPVRDNLARALEEKGDIRSGVELIIQEFDSLLQNEGVQIIEPEPGSDVNPECNEVLARVDSELESGVIVECYRPGYRIGETLIRPARVTVSETNSE